MLNRDVFLNSVKDLRCGFLGKVGTAKLLTIFTKTSIVDVRLSSKYVFVRTHNSTLIYNELFFLFQKKKCFFQDVSSFTFLLNPKTSKPETLLLTLLQIRSYTFDCFFRIVDIIKNKFGQTLVPIMPSISNLFIHLLSRLETSSSTFYDFDKVTL